MAEPSCHPQAGSSSQHPSSMGAGEEGSWEQEGSQGLQASLRNEALTYRQGKVTLA